MPATRCTALATAMWMINRIHCNTADRRPYAPPPLGSRFAEFAQRIFRVTDLPNGCSAVQVHSAHFPGAKSHQSIATFAAQLLD